MRIPELNPRNDPVTDSRCGRLSAQLKDTLPLCPLQTGQTADFRQDALPRVVILALPTRTQKPTKKKKTTTIWFMPIENDWDHGLRC